MRTTLMAKEVSIVAIFTAMTGVLAQIAVPLPFTPMPISFGLVAVYITGMLLKPKHAVLAQLSYLIIGAIGVPVFGNFRGGIGALLGPTGGYLLVYPIMAVIVSMVLNSKKSLQLEVEQSRKWRFLKAALAISVAHFLLYLSGTTWLSLTTGTSFYAALTLSVFPFIPLDVVKILFCVFAIMPFRARLRSMNLLILDPVVSYEKKSDAKAINKEQSE